MLERAARTAARHFVVLTSYLGALTVLVLSLSKLNQPLKALFGDHSWLLVTVALLPLACLLAFEAIPSALGFLREKRLKDGGVHGVMSRPGYFRITPYEDKPEDQESYSRADGAHLEVGAWLEQGDQPVLYLTGLSGAGKSSLMNAYVLPRLRLVPDLVRPIVVPRHDPFQGLRRILLSPGVVWKKPPADDQSDLRDLVRKASEYLGKTRLLLIFDQFEEVLIFHERDKARVDELHDLMGLVRDSKVRNLTFLFVFRSDYKGLFHGLSRRLDLPSLRQDDNWKEVGPFTEGQARDFLVQSGLTIGDGLMDQVFGQIAEIEEAEGLVRPITLNMIGLVLARSSRDSVRSLPKHREAGGLLFGYLRQSIRHTRVRDHARPILRAMISPAGTKSPQGVGELAARTGFKEDVVVGCLLELVEPGLVRRIDERENVWEISHDFVARLLSQILSAWRTGLIRRARPWAVPAALVAWVLIFLVVPAAAPWYKRLPLAEIRRLDATGQSPLHLAASEGDKDEAAIAVAYFLANGADVNLKNRDGLTSLHIAASNGHIGVMKALLAGRADLGLVDPLGETALHKATANGDVEAINVLLAGNKAHIEAKNKEGLTSLFIASTRGLDEALKALLARGADVNARDPKKHTALHLAAINGNASIAKALVVGRADKEAKDDSGHTPLHETAIEGKPEVATVLLAERVNTEAIDNLGATPLIWAANNGRSDVARLLLDNKANPETKDPAGNTCLYWASNNGHLATVKAMLDKAPSPPHSATNAVGATPLHAAAANGHAPVVATLLEHGANPEARDNFGNTPLITAAMANRAEAARLLLDREANPEAKENGGLTALFWASNSGHLATVKSMLDKPPRGSLAATSSTGATPLHAAAANGHGPVLSVLLEHGADLEARDNFGNTPLITAAMANRAEAARLLLDREANPEAKENGGLTALFWASSNGLLATVKAMLDKAPSPSHATTNLGGAAPLHAAAANGHELVVAALLDHGADVELKDNFGWTPLLQAAGGNRLEVVRSLLKRGGKLDSKDNEGFGVLHHASQRGFKEMIGFLLERGAEVDSRNIGGFTPLHMAAAQGHAGLVKFLLEQGASVESAANSLVRPMHSAAGGIGDAEVVKILLAHKAEVGPKDSSEATPLHHAVQQRRFEVVKILLQHQADPSAKDSAGRTPVDLARTLADKKMLGLLEGR